jgi:hypothetical protein
MTDTYAEGMCSAFDAVARCNAWTAAMGSYVNGYEKGFRTGADREAERLKAMYVDGSLTIEAFEARLNVTFGLSRETNAPAATS